MCLAGVATVPCCWFAERGVPACACLAWCGRVATELCLYLLFRVCWWHARGHAAALSCTLMSVASHASLVAGGSLHAVSIFPCTPDGQLLFGHQPFLGHCVCRVQFLPVTALAGLLCCLWVRCGPLGLLRMLMSGRLLLLHMLMWGRLLALERLSALERMPALGV